MKNARRYLAIPIDDKDIAKNLGGRWDPEKRSWWIPPGSELEIVAKWFEKEKTREIDNLSDSYILRKFKGIECRFSNANEILEFMDVDIKDIVYVDGVSYFCPACDSRWSDGYILRGILNGSAVSLYHSHQFEKNISDKERFMLYSFLDGARMIGIIPTVVSSCR